MTEAKRHSDLKNSIHDLEKYGREFNHSCTKNIVMVLKDQRVQETFDKHSSWQENFGGLSCHRFGKDGVGIVFWFQYKVPRSCIISPAFAVEYDPTTSTIIQIMDPFIDKKLLPSVH